MSFVRWGSIANQKLTVRIKCGLSLSETILCPLGSTDICFPYAVNVKLNFQIDVQLLDELSFYQVTIKEDMEHQTTSTVKVDIKFTLNTQTSILNAFTDGIKNFSFVRCDTIN